MWCDPRQTAAAPPLPRRPPAHRRACTSAHPLAAGRSTQLAHAQSSHPCTDTAGEVHSRLRAICIFAHVCRRGCCVSWFCCHSYFAVRPSLSFLLASSCPFAASMLFPISLSSLLSHVCWRAVPAHLCCRPGNHVDSFLGSSRILDVFGSTFVSRVSSP